MIDCLVRNEQANQHSSSVGDHNGGSMNHNCLSFKNGIKNTNPFSLAARDSGMIYETGVDRSLKVLLASKELACAALELRPSQGPRVEGGRES